MKSNPKEVISVPLNDNRIVAIHLYKDRISYYLSDGHPIKFNHKSTIHFKVAKSYRQIIGRISNNDSTILILTDKNPNVFSMLIFDHNAFQHKEIPIINLKETKELLISSDTNNNIFTLLTIAKKTSLLKVIRVNPDSQLQNFEFDLNHFSFDEFYPELYFRLIDLTGSADRPIEVVKINDLNSSSLSETSHAKKVYFDNTNIFLTLDDKTAKTTVINLNLKAGQATAKDYSEPLQDFVCGVNTTII